MKTDFEKYMAWNQLTRHQLITAHMILISGVDQAVQTLAKALDTTTSYGLRQLADQAAAKIAENS